MSEYKFFYRRYHRFTQIGRQLLGNLKMSSSYLIRYVAGTGINTVNRGRKKDKNFINRDRVIKVKDAIFLPNQQMISEQS